MARKTNKTIYATDEKWEMVNEFNKELFKSYIDYLRSVDRSNATILNYSSNIKIIMVWFMEYAGNKRLVDMKKRDIVNFQNWLINVQKYSPAHVRGLRSMLSSVSNYIENILDDEFPDFKNIVNKIEAPSLSHIREKTVLTEDQLEKLLNTLIKNKDYQEACMVACLAYSGMRKSEVCQVKESFFGEENVFYGMYKTPKIRLKGRGTQGKRENKYIIKSMFDPYLNLWLEERKNKGITTEELFVVKNKNGYSGISGATLAQWCDKFTKILGVDVYPHAFRHFFATMLASRNFPLSKIKDLMNHESASTSEIYIDRDKEDNLKGLFDENGIVMQEKQQDIN
jgi:integrase/recombinase XerD